MAESERESLIKSVDRSLAADPEFGDPQPILKIVEERYHFGLELFAERLPAAAELLRVVPGWPAEVRKELFFDPLVQFWMEDAFERLERRELRSPHPLEEICHWASESLKATGRLGLTEHEIGSSFRVGPRRQLFLWDVKRSTHPLVQRLMKNFDAYFMEGTDARAELRTPDAEMAHALDQAFSVFADMLPHTAASVLGHTHSIALAIMRLGGARLLTGSAGDGLPGVVLLSPEELRNPWDTAGHLLHEGLHTRFADISRFSALVARNADVEFPWREQENDFTVARALSAFHVYVHFVLYEAAVREFGHRFHEKYGPPDRHPVSAHAMSVVRVSGKGPFATGMARCRYLGEQLATAWTPLLTPEGRRFVRWLLECLEPLGTEATAFLDALRERERAEGVASAPVRPPPPGEETLAARRLWKNPGLRARPITDAGYLLAFVPEAPRVQLLNLHSWLISELCDGRSQSAIGEQYRSIVGADLSPEQASSQLNVGLEQLEACHIITSAHHR
ncbi:hypothetical protein [Archangium sp.]|uniref:hypothetical protein n=1 Tax=Archangium sp. TaxID=1872627 RepID=UPI002D42E1FC|nr:hypothetical protein [Archangium sp.]HYO56171.1 hypothetical protein [Archangium sp.]